MRFLNNKTSHTVQRLKNPSPRTLNIAVKAVLVVLILVVGYLLSEWIKSSAPTAKLRPPEVAAPYVETDTLTVTTKPVEIEVMGTVIPKTKVDLKSRVSGQIIAVNTEYIEGGIILQNTDIVRIDPKDYELAVLTQKAKVADAQYNFRLEEGQQVVARNEWELLKNSGAFQKVTSTDLALRKPHLEKAKADLAAARAELDQAELDLFRTKLTLPFNALVLSRNADLGSQIGTQETVATLADVSAYYVQASLSADKLRWLKFSAHADDRGSPATVYYADGQTIQGHVVKVLGDLEENGRMARVLVEIPDPLGLTAAQRNQTPLLLGSYVRVTLHGLEAADIIAINRNYLRDNEKVWLYSEGRLRIVPVDVLWRGRNEVYLTNTELKDARLVTTNLPAPIHGMALRLKEQNSVNGKFTATMN